MLDPYPILKKARKKPLSCGEVDALALHISNLERQVRAAQEHNLSVCSQSQVELSLNRELSAFLVTLPGTPPHSISIPLAQGGAFTQDFLVKLLKARRGVPSRIASPGAPTQADLEALAKASKKAPKCASAVVSLEDLEL